MPSRTIRDTYPQSDKVAAMDPGPQDRFPRYWLLADDYGCFRAHAADIKGRIYARRADITPEVVSADLAEYARVGSLIVWNVDDKTFAFFSGWWGSNRAPRPGTSRKFPRPDHPDAEPPTRKTQTKENQSLSSVPQKPAEIRRNPQKSAPAVAVRSSQSHTQSQAQPQLNAREAPIAVSDPWPAAELQKLHAALGRKLLETSDHEWQRFVISSLKYPVAARVVGSQKYQGEGHAPGSHSPVYVLKIIEREATAVSPSVPSDRGRAESERIGREAAAATEAYLKREREREVVPMPEHMRQRPRLS